LIERKHVSTNFSLQKLDLARAVQFFTMDVITDLSFGEEFGFLRKDEDVHDYCANVATMLPTMNVISLFPRLSSGMDSPKKKGFLRFCFNCTSPRYVYTFAHANWYTHISVAGADTTATAIRSTLLHLITSPNAYSNLKNEIKSALADHRVSSPIQYDEAQRLL
jgi:hypothetical protein